MKKIHSTVILLFACVAIGTMFSFADGFATTKTQGITKAPKDWDYDGDGVGETCAHCHTGGNFDPSLEITVKNTSNQNVLGYTPGASYSVHVKINHGSGTPDGYGFQLVGIVDADSSGINKFTNISSNAKEVAGIFGRYYYEHKNGVSVANEFTFDWVAPTAGTGDITFYSSGIAVYKNAANSGDGAANNKLTLQEGQILSNQSSFSIANIRLLGNPSVDEIHIVLDATLASDATISLYDINGQQVINAKQDLVVGSNPISLDATSLKEGVYILSVQTKQGNITKKVLLMH